MYRNLTFGASRIDEGFTQSYPQSDRFFAQLYKANKSRTPRTKRYCGSSQPNQRVFAI